MRRVRNLEKVRDLDIKELACRQEWTKVLELKSFSHEDLKNHICVDWLKAHEARIFRERTLETADSLGVPSIAILASNELSNDASF